MNDYIQQVISNMHSLFQIIGWICFGASIAGYWIGWPIIKFESIDDPDDGKARIKKFERILLSILITGIILLVASIFCPSL